jgi:hypothetical protein
VGFLLLPLLIARADIEAYGRALARADLDWILGAAVLSLLATVVKGLRWRILLFGAGIELERLAAVRITWVGSSLGLLTPGKVGELVRIAYLSDRGAAWLPALQSVITDRMLDLLCVVTFALWGAVSWHEGGVRSLSGVAGSWLVATTALFLVLGSQRRFARLVRGFFSRVIKEERFQRARSQAGEPVSFSLGVLVSAWSLSVVFFLLLAARVYLLVRALGYRPPEWEFLRAVSLAFSVMALPISFMDIGTREVGFVYFFSPLGVTTSDSLAVSTLLFLLVLLQTMTGVVLWFLWPPVPLVGVRDGTEGDGLGFGSRRFVPGVSSQRRGGPEQGDEGAG